MSYIGLRHNSSTSGTDWASILSKAMTTDPSNEINYQLMMSRLQGDALDRQLKHEQITKATYDAIAQAKLNQYKQEEFNRNTNAGVGRGLILEAAAANEQARRQATAATEAPVVVEAPVPYASPGPMVPAEPIPPEIVSAFPARPEAVPPTPMPLPTITGRPDAPQPSMIPQAPVSGFAVRPAGPELAMPPPPINLPDPRLQPEQPVPVDVGTGGSLPSEEAMNIWGRQHLPGLFGNQQTAIAGRPAGPALPQHSPPPEAPVPVDMLPMPPLPGPAVAPGVPVPIPLQQVAVPDVNRPSEVRPPVQAEPPLPIESVTAPPSPQPDQPVPIMPLVVPQPQPTTPQPPDPNAGIVKAGTGDFLPAGAPTPPAQILPGETVDHGDGTVSVNVGRGPTRLTHEQYQALGLQDAFNADAAGQTTKDAGTIKTIYDQNTGFTPAQQAEILSGTPPIGTKEEIAMKQATAAATDHFGPVVTGAEAAKLGLAPDKAYQQNAKTNKWDQVGGSGVNVSVNTKGENKFDETIGAKQAEVITKIYDDAITANADSLALDELDKMLAKAPTGGFAPLKVWAKNSLGMDLEGADDLTAADALIAKLIPAERASGSGTMSDRDVALYRKGLPSILNKPGGNAKVVKTLRDLIEYRKARGVLAEKAMAGTMDRTTFLSEVNKLPNPLAADTASDGATTGSTDAAPAASATTAPAAPPAKPAGVDAEVWNEMTPAEKENFR